MKYAFGDPGNPNCSLKGLRLSCRITRGKGEALVEIAEDQEPFAVERMRQMVAFLEWAISQRLTEGEQAQGETFDETLRMVKASHAFTYRWAADALERELAE